jgi:hypothetical protein
MRIFADDRLIVTYEIPGQRASGSGQRFYEALKRSRDEPAQIRSGRHGKGRAKCTISPLKPLHDMDVEIRSPHVYDSMIGVGI